jgi:hypothetical protein
LPGINKKMLETIEKSDYPEDIKELLKALLNIELKLAGDKKPRYSEDYDRKIKEVLAKRGFKGEL